MDFHNFMQADLTSNWFILKCNASERVFEWLFCKDSCSCQIKIAVVRHLMREEHLTQLYT